MVTTIGGLITQVGRMVPLRGCVVSLIARLVAPVGGVVPPLGRDVTLIPCLVASLSGGVSLFGGVVPSVIVLVVLICNRQLACFALGH